MSPQNIEKVIIKYLTQEANSDDLDVLSEWIQIPENQVFFENYVKIHYKITLAMSEPDVDQIKTNLLKRIKRDKDKVRKIKVRRSVFKYAAAAILVVALASTYFLRDSIFNNQTENTAPVIVNNQIEKGTDKATLTLETGETIALVKGASFQTQNASSNGEQIVYLPAGQAGQQQSSSRARHFERSREARDNTLTIPRGGQFRLTLSDGTKVWLNSETRLKYPVSFVDGESRQVELVYGEAYFDVSPSTEHNGADFKVLNNQQEVQVLGTEFNIKAYKDENNVYTTLVEGKVAVSYEGKKQNLVPGQQSNVNVATNTLTVSAVDVSTETSWKEGVFKFRAMALKDIMTVLSRWYDIDVVFENKTLLGKDITFKGVLGKNQDIQIILDAIKSSKTISNYEIHGKTIVLK